MSDVVVFGRYQIIRRLATGGMGEIFLARQRGVAGFDRLAILKSLLPELAEDEASLSAFLDEARVAALVDRPRLGACALQRRMALVFKCLLGGEEHLSLFGGPPSFSSSY